MGISEIKIAHIIQQYSTYEDGQTVCNEIKKQLQDGNAISLSFEGIVGVPSSFVNGLLNDLIAEIGLDGIKQKVKITHSTKIINDMLKRKFTLSA